MSILKQLPKKMGIILLLSAIASLITNISGTYFRRVVCKTVEPYTDHYTIRYHGLDTDGQGVLYLGEREQVTGYALAGHAILSFPVSGSENTMTFNYCFEVLDDGIVI